MARFIPAMVKRASRPAFAATIALVVSASVTETPRAEPAPPPAPDAPGSKARGPLPDGLHQWAGQIQQNYPKGVLSPGQKATVMVRTIVDPAGTVAGCVVVQSSGYAPLDQAACESMQRFAVFRPAIDAEGEPTSGTWATKITYSENSPSPAGSSAPRN